MEQEDQLSNLPIVILHDILSRLPIEYVVQTSVLSKGWAKTCSTFPNLFFSDTSIIGEKKKSLIESEDYWGKRNKFICYVDTTLLRFRNQGLSIKQFTLSLKCFNLHNLSKDVDLWLKLVSESGVEVLKLWQPMDECKEEDVNDKCYILPTCVLEAKSLTKLWLARGIELDLSFISRSIRFFSLQNLYLEEVTLKDEQALKHLISCCPLIEYITLKYCFLLKLDGEGEWGLREFSNNSMMKSMCMCGLPRLKDLVVFGIQEVCVDSPCLECLEYFPDYWDEPCKIDFNKCKNLRELDLSNLESTIITSKWFLELFAKFPFLDTVLLEQCTMSESINISSVQLKALRLIRCPNLKEVNIDAPNLLSCNYEGCPIERVNVMVHIYDLNFYNFRKFIQNFQSPTVITSVSLCIYELMDGLDPADFQVVDPVDLSPLSPSVKHLNLQVELKEEALYLPLVYALFSNCCPTTISVRLHCFWCRKFIEFLYATLIYRNEYGCFDYSCHYGHSKCWLHRLKDVKLETPTKIVKKFDFKNMLDKLQNSGRDIIFKLEF